MGRWPFQEMVSAVVRLKRQAAESFDDPMTHYAGGDGTALVARAIQSAERRLIAESGWTPDEFNEELARRTTSRWAYHSGLYL
jgi:hypothetical protein